MGVLFGLRSPSQTSRRMSRIILGTAGGQALVILGTPVLTRLYSTADFGTLTVFTSAVGIIAALATLRLDAAIGLPESTAQAAALGWSAMAATAVIGGLVAAIGTLCGEPVARALGAPDLAGMWWLVGA